jgi:hypothetical protein
MPLLSQAFPDRPPFLIVELEAQDGNGKAPGAART